MQNKTFQFLTTDGFKSYNELEKYIDRMTVNHSKEFSRGVVNVNTIEGFWSSVKIGIRGSLKPLVRSIYPYIIEFEWKFNNRISAVTSSRNSL